MINRIGTIYPCGSNKGFSSRFYVDCWVGHETPDEVLRTYRPKHSECCILTLDQAVNQRFLCTGRTCVNKQKQSCGWTEMCECYEIIYADVRHRQSQSCVSLSLGPKVIRSVTKSTSEWLGTPLRQRSTEQLRSYGSIWQSDFNFVFVCLSHTTEALTPKKE